MYINFLRPRAFQLPIPCILVEEGLVTSFMERSSSLPLRRPEATSQQRLSSFNQNNVNLFYQNWKTVLDRHQFQAKDIWNINETGI